MEIQKINKKDSSFQIFLEKANEAYLARSSETIPFSPLTNDNIKDEEQIFIIIDGD